LIPPGSHIARRLTEFLPGALIRARGIVRRMGKKSAREHVFVETDGQVYLVRDRGRFRFPRAGETLPFPTDPNGVMDFGGDRVAKRTPRLDHHPEEWMGRDAVFERSDVDALVKRAIYTTMIRCVSEVVLSSGPRVLMVKAVRGFSKGHWNIPGGFMDYGEGPEAGVEREVRLKPLKPSHALIEAAEETEARMIVVGSYGEAPLKGVIIGSTPYRLLHVAQCPVLVVPAKR